MQQGKPYTIICSKDSNSIAKCFVYEKSSGEPVIFCNVILKGTTIGASTDINGMYIIANVLYCTVYNMIYIYGRVPKPRCFR